MPLQRLYEDYTILCLGSLCPISLTLNGRIHIKTLFRLPQQHKTEDAGWQHGYNPVFAMVFGIASEAFVVLYGSVYHRSPRYKSLFPNPEASHLT